MGGMGRGQSPMKTVPTRGRSPAVTPTKSMSPASMRGSPVRGVRGGMVASRGRGAPTAIRGARGSPTMVRGRGVTPTRGAVRGMPATRGSPGMRGAPTRGMAPASRGRVATSASRGGVTTSRGMMAAARGMMPTSRGAVTPQRGRGRPPGMAASSAPQGVRQSSQMAQALAQRGGRGGITISTVRDGPRAGGGPPPLRGAPGMQMRPQQPRAMGPNQIRPGQGQMDPYYMAAYGGAPKPANNYPPNSMAPGMHQYGNYQMRPQVQQHQPVVQQPQHSPGSSWHTPQGMQNMMPAQSQPQQIDNSFKITIPRKTTPEVIKIDLDGAPIIPASAPSVTSSTRPPNIPSNISITPSSAGGSQMSLSSSSSLASTPSSSTPNLVNHNNIPKGISISSSGNSSFNPQAGNANNAGPPKPNDNGIPDLSSLLEEEDWINSQV